MTSSTRKAAKRRKKPLKQMKKKAVRPSTTRSTAGPGFDFEDHVAAWLLLKVLTGQPLPGIDGIGTRLQTQVEALSWVIDDILLTASAAPDDQRHLAISCKSNVQVTASRLPADFVMRCWKQWAQANPNPMQRGMDRLMLVTRGRNNAFMATWSDLKNAAPGADVALAVGRMTATAKHRKIFESVKAPAKDAGVTVTDGDVVAMINSMEVVPLDFQIADSESEKLAIAQSRMLLVNGGIGEGKRLWRELVAQAKNVRLGSGTLKIPDLWRQLRREYALKDHPDYEASWQKLRALTRDYKKTIETALRSGLALERKGEIDKLLERMASDAVSIVFGESGSGKSALVKTILNERFPNAAQVWFGPDTLDRALNEATRTNLGIDQPLINVLDATAHVDNFLVIDAAERLSHECVLKAKALIEALQRRNKSEATVGWHVLIIGQTEAWVLGTLQELASTASPTNFEVEELSFITVKDVLRSVAGLEWLVTHSDAVSALTNLRTLAWVIQAAAQFHAQGGNVTLSLTAIADRLWTHWTENKPSVHRLLVRLAEREARFEHSFAISQLESGDAAVLDDLPVACPLRKDGATGRIQFQHDLAADWARFQRLKEIAGDTAQWARFAGNPFWHSALRILGQLLLRQQFGTRNAWDVAFEWAEQNRETAPLAEDMLLDALFLDPNAEAFLEQRADMLLANGGGRLLRLVKRFEHVGSVPGVSPDIQGRFGDLSLYIETHFRTPIFGRWPAIARFLSKHRDRVAKMTSPAIASVCNLWLTSTPPVLSGGARVPFRQEFAELALATAREMQLGHAKGIIYLVENETLIYQAAFAGAPDLIADVLEWALEMAHRRPYRSDIVEQVRAHRAEQAAEHKRRLESDPVYRERHEERMSLPRSISSGRRLSPWPLGPKHRIEGRFREAVMRSAGFQALMRIDAEVAGEVLLACIIESEPEEEYGSSRGVNRELGIEFDDEGYPTAPWKSPFYAFLRINPDVALGYLHQLVNFSTDRWVYAASKRSGSDPATLSLRLADGAVHEYAGNYWVFTWSHQNSNFDGQLHSALAALERWLCDLIDTGIDVASRIDTLLRVTKSVAMLGVLVNVGKHRVELFKGPLRPLLGVQRIYEWDSRRAEENAFGFDTMAWARSGEFVFEMAKNWVLAPYRRRKLREIISQIIVADRGVSDFVAAATSQWVSPKSEKEALEFRALVAELDYRNYSSVFDPKSGKQAFEFAYPPDIAKAIVAFQHKDSLAIQALTFPQKCREALNQASILTSQSAEWVAWLMVALDGDEEIDVEEDMLRAPRVAAAAMLLLCAPDWLAQNAVVQQRAQSIIDAAIADIVDTSEVHGPRISTAPSHLEFAAYFVVARWILDPSRENDERLLRLLTSDDDAAVRVLVWSAYQNREALGQRWWRLLYLALLWSGLSMLIPRYGDEEGATVRWQGWRRWLRTRSLSTETTWSSINPQAIAERVERLEYRRWRRRYVRDGRVFTMEPGRRLSGGLDTHFLKSAFAWLFRNQADHVIPAQELETHRQLVAAFWSHQAWWLSGSGKDENDHYRPMHEFGYALLEELARLVLESSASRAPTLWRPVFALGPKGHYAISHFLTCWFQQLTNTTVVAEFAQRWRPMIEFMVLDSEWSKDGPWYYGQRLEREVLGFGASNSIRRAAGHAELAGMMRDLFRIWAQKRLTRDEDNLAGFCGFLADEVGKPLRMDGLQWIADAMKANPNIGKWFRDRASSAFMEFLDVLVSQHAVELRQDEKLRQALLDLSAHAVSRQLTAALTLHERIRRLL
jgi:hypothetical protein